MVPWNTLQHSVTCAFIAVLYRDYKLTSQTKALYCSKNQLYNPVDLVNYPLLRYSCFRKWDQQFSILIIGSQNFCQLLNCRFTVWNKAYFAVLVCLFYLYIIYALRSTIKGQLLHQCFNFNLNFDRNLKIYICLAFVFWWFSLYRWLCQTFSLAILSPVYNLTFPLCIYCISLSLFGADFHTPT